MICSEKPPPIEPSHQPTLLVGKPTAGPPTYPQSASLLSCQSSQHTKSVLSFRSLRLSVCVRQRWGIPVRHAEHFTDRLRPLQWKGVTHRLIILQPGINKSGLYRTFVGSIASRHGCCVCVHLLQPVQLDLSGRVKWAEMRSCGLNK